MGVNSLPKTVIRQCRDFDLNPGPSVPESSMLTTRLPSHSRQTSVKRVCVCVCVCALSAFRRNRRRVSCFSSWECAFWWKSEQLGDATGDVERTLPRDGRRKPASKVGDWGLEVRQWTAATEGLCKPHCSCKTEVGRDDSQATKIYIPAQL